MPESYVQLKPDSSHGKKTRERERVVGANTVYEQCVSYTGRDSFYVLADDVPFAVNTQALSLLNAAASGVAIRIHKLFLINTILMDAAGTRIRFDVKRATAHSGGTLLTPVGCDSENAALPDGVTARTGATSVTEGSKLFPLLLPNDEIGYTQAFWQPQILAGFNWMPEGLEMQELTLREGEGITVKQITSSVIGTFSWLVVFTVEAL